jgi:hypothetical protein
MASPFPSSNQIPARSTASGPAGATIIGWKAWGLNAQGQIVTRDSRSVLFRNLPSSGMLALAVFYDLTYVTGEGNTRHYRTLMHSQDYYWWNATDGSFGSGWAELVPAGLPGNMVKTSGLLDEAAWRAFITARADEHVWTP